LPVTAGNGNEADNNGDKNGCFQEWHESGSFR